MPAKSINIRSPRPASKSTQLKATSQQSPRNLVDISTSTNAACSDDDQLLQPSEVADILGLSVKTLANKRSSNCGPEYVKLGDSRKAAVRYPRRKLLKWIADHTRKRDNGD